MKTTENNHGLPSHIECGAEARKYTIECGGKANDLVELAFYNGTLFLRDECLKSIRKTSIEFVKFFNERYMTGETNGNDPYKMFSYEQLFDIFSKENELKNNP